MNKPVDWFTSQCCSALKISRKLTPSAVWGKIVTSNKRCSGGNTVPLYGNMSLLFATRNPRPENVVPTPHIVLIGTFFRWAAVWEQQGQWAADFLSILVRECLFEYQWLWEPELGRVVWEYRLSDPQLVLTLSIPIIVGHCELFLSWEDLQIVLKRFPWRNLVSYKVCQSLNAKCWHFILLLLFLWTKVCVDCCHSHTLSLFLFSSVSLL